MAQRSDLTSDGAYEQVMVQLLSAPYIDPTARVADKFVSAELSLEFVEYALAQTCPFVGRFHTTHHITCTAHENDAERVRAIVAAFQLSDDHCTIRVAGTAAQHPLCRYETQLQTDLEWVNYAVFRYDMVCPLATKLWLPPNRTVFLVPTTAAQTDTWRFLRSCLPERIDLSNHLSVFVGSVESAQLQTATLDDDTTTVRYAPVTMANNLADARYMPWKNLVGSGRPSSAGFGHCVAWRDREFRYCVFAVVLRTDRMEQHMFDVPLIVTDDVVTIA